MHIRSVRLAGLVAGAALCAPLAAQTPATPATPAPAAPAAPARVPLHIGPVVISGSLRARGEGWDWFEAPGYEDSYAFGATLLRVAGAYSRPRLDVQVELSQPTLVGLPDNAVAPAPQGQLGLGATYRAASGAQDASVFLKQAFVRFKRLGDPGNSVRLGRVEFSDGSEIAPADAALAWVKRERIAHRLIGNFGFSHVQRSFDAVQLTRDTRRANLTLFGGFPTRGVFNLDGQASLTDVDVEYAALSLPARATEARLFAIRYHDGRGLAATDNRPAALRTAERAEGIDVATVGGHLLHAVPTAAGKVDLMLWGALQGGSWGSQDHGAHAFAAEAGFQPDLPLRPWLRAGYLRGSGDDTPESAAGGDHGTFFQVLPTPRIYARTPFYNQMNSEDAFAQLLLRPDARTTLRTDVHRLRLAESADLWYAGGGAFDDEVFGYQGRASGGLRDLGTVLDLSIDRQLGALTSVTAYGGHVWGGDVVSRLHPAGSSGSYLYLEVTQRF